MHICTYINTHTQVAFRTIQSNVAFDTVKRERKGTREQKKTMKETYLCAKETYERDLFAFDTVKRERKRTRELVYLRDEGGVTVWRERTFVRTYRTYIL